MDTNKRPEELFKIWASIPKSPIKEILITKLVTETLKANYEGDTYLIVNIATWLRMEQLFAQVPIICGIYSIRAIENDDLVKKILIQCAGQINGHRP